MTYYENYLAHHGVKGMRWGVRNRTRNYNATLNNYRLFRKMSANAPRDEYGEIISKDFPKYFRNTANEIRRGSNATNKADDKYSTIQRAKSVGSKEPSSYYKVHYNSYERKLARRIGHKYDRIHKKYTKISKSDLSSAPIKRAELNRAADFAAANEVFARYKNSKKYKDILGRLYKEQTVYKYS